MKAAFQSESPGRSRSTTAVPQHFVLLLPAQGLPLAAQDPRQLLRTLRQQLVRRSGVSSAVTAIVR
jgi:hypothetical protein